MIRTLPIVMAGVFGYGCGGGPTCTCVLSEGSQVDVQVEVNSFTECAGLPADFPDRGYQRCSANNDASIVGPIGAESGAGDAPVYLDEGTLPFTAMVQAARII